MTASPAGEPFVRDRLTWLGYLLMGNYSYILAAMGPLMPALRAELGLSYTIAALHFSAWAFGVLNAGIFGNIVMTKLGRRRTIWLCGSMVMIGIALITLGHSPVLTISGTWIAGLTGNIMCQTINTMMADRFGADRTLAITESNIIAVVWSSSAPLVVGAVLGQHLDWRLAMCIPVAIFTILSLTFWDQPIPSSPQVAHASNGSRLPVAYWAYWCVIFFSVAAEWSIIFWSPEFLHSVVHHSKGEAARAVSFFLISMLIGRITGRRLVSSISSNTLLFGASILSIAGFLMFWLGNTSMVNLAGLVVAGLGIANFYPLSMSAALGAAPHQTSKAAARISISTGGAILAAPLVLGYLADHTSIFVAYGLVLALLCVVLGMVLWVTRLTNREQVADQSLIPQP